MTDNHRIAHKAITFSIYRHFPDLNGVKANEDGTMTLKFARSPESEYLRDKRRRNVYDTCKGILDRSGLPDVTIDVSTDRGSIDSVNVGFIFHF